MYYIWYDACSLLLLLNAADLGISLWSGYHILFHLTLCWTDFSRMTWKQPVRWPAAYELNNFVYLSQTITALRPKNVNWIQFMFKCPHGASGYHIGQSLSNKYHCWSQQQEWQWRQRWAKSCGQDETKRLTAVRGEESVDTRRYWVTIQFPEVQHFRSWVRPWTFLSQLLKQPSNVSVLWNIRVLHNDYLIIKYSAFLFCFLCFFRKGDSNFLKIHPLLLTIPITVTPCPFTHHSQTPSYPLLFLFPPPEPLSVLQIVMLSQSPWPLDTVIFAWKLHPHP